MLKIIENNLKRPKDLLRESEVKDDEIMPVVLTLLLVCFHDFLTPILELLFFAIHTDY